MAGVVVRNESPRFRKERSAVCSVRGRPLPDHADGVLQQRSR